MEGHEGVVPRELRGLLASAVLAPRRPQRCKAVRLRRSEVYAGVDGGPLHQPLRLTVAAAATQTCKGRIARVMLRR